MAAAPVEVAADADTPRGPPVAARLPPAGKHGLHGLAGVRPDSAATDRSASGDAADGETSPGKVPACELVMRLRLAAVLEEVCRHYGVAFGAIALERKDVQGVIDFTTIRGVSKEGEAALRRHGAEDAHPDDLKLFRHHMRRQLPVIIEDTHEVRSLREHRLITGKPNIKLYVAAPLIKAPGKIVGTISIFDSSERSSLEVSDCEALQKAAAEAVELLPELP